MCIVSRYSRYKKYFDKILFIRKISARIKFLTVRRCAKINSALKYLKLGKKYLVFGKISKDKNKCFAKFEIFQTLKIIC